MTAPYETLVPSIGETVQRWANITEGGADALIALLLDREDQIADLLRVNAEQFGAMPPLTAEVLCQIGIGRPVTAEERAFIHQQFHATIEQLQREMGE